MQRRDVLATGAVLALVGCMGGSDDDDGIDSNESNDDGIGYGGDDAGSEQTLTVAADLSVDDDTVLVQVTNGGEELDGITLVDDGGNVQDVIHEAIETGGSYELTATEDGTVYGYQASDEPSSIDELDATVNLGSFEFEES